MSSDGRSAEKVRVAFVCVQNRESQSGRPRRRLVRVAFVCVQNVGRSQMAYAFARREQQKRDLEKVELSTGGTRPAGHANEEAVTAMRAAGIDTPSRTPHEITVEELQNSEYVVTMGCSAADVCPAGWAGDSRDWELKDSGGRPPDEVAAICEEIERRVRALFEELEEAVR